MPNNDDIVWDEPVANNNDDIVWDDTEPKGTHPLKRAMYGFADPFVGAAQLIGKGVEAIGGENQFSKSIADTYKDWGKDVVDPDGGMDWWRAAGGLTNPVNVVGPGKFGKAATGLKYLAQRGGAHTAVNAGQGVLTPTQSEDYWGSKGEDALMSALLGGAMSTGGKVAGKSVNAYKNATADTEGAVIKYLKDLSGGNSAEVANILRNVKGNVEGEQPTVSWAALEDNGKFPFLASLEHKARRSADQGGAFNQRDAANKAAQLRAMDNIIGEGADVFDEAGKRVKTPIQQRTADTTRPMYDQAGADRIHVPEPQSRAIDAAQNQDILNQQELNRVAGWDDSAAVRGATPTRSVNQPEFDIMDPTLSNQNLDDPFSVLPTDTIASLQAKRKAIDARIAGAKDGTSADAANLLNLQRARRGITDRMRGASPAFKEADDTFQEMITPQNRADYVKVLRGEFANEGGGSPQLLKAIDDAPATGRKAGLPMGVDSTTHVMRPNVEGGQQAIDAVDALRKSARRDTDVGRVTNTELGKVATVGDAVDKYVPPLLNPVITTSKRFLKNLGAATNEEAQKLLNEAALNPQIMADLLEGVPPVERGALVNLIRKGNSLGGQSLKAQAIRESTRDRE